MSAMFTQRTGSMSLEGFWLVNSANGQRDPGQSKVESAAVQVGYAAYRDFRVRATPSGYGELGNFVFTGQAGIGERGGSVTDVMPWSVDLIFEGKPQGSGVFSYFN